MRIAELRVLMKARGIDAYIIPHGDAHASEYMAEHWLAREWISGFTGSAGLVVVTANKAGLWTDGRYFIQAARELNDQIELYKSGEPDVLTYQAFLEKELPTGGKLGFDGRTITAAEFAKIKEALEDKNLTFAYKEDLVGELWKDRPSMPTAKAFEHPIQFAGKTVAEKLADVRAKMKEKRITAYLLTALDSVAWLFNFRGNDIKFFPVSYAFALITHTEAHVFIDSEKITLPDAIQHDYDALPKFLQDFKTEKLFYNPNTTNVLLAEAIPKGMDASKLLKPHEDIVPMLKAVKSPTELANIKNAYIKDGIVMVKMLYWLYAAMRDNPPVTEGDIVRTLKNLRKEQPFYVCDSFATISAYGENAALSHYNSGETGTTLRAEGFFLIDTGGQYLDGTTDTTRTICLGTISEEMKRDFTLVLKGNIALSRAIFLKGTTGSALDILARKPLWEHGKNYRHGTGHGLGYCLGVHEGPHNITQLYNPVPLAEGMIISNEPALYKEGHYGIRIENIIAVAAAAARPLFADEMQSQVHARLEASSSGDSDSGNCDNPENPKNPDGTFLSFETLTYCPIDLNAIAPELLTEIERNHLNAYHQKTYEILSPHLTPEESEWLKEATQPI
ncbi:MAG: aminopeptidase P family protein [Defluviitaleaceae bacterium]|nr:aminopeptidase P family protein [Defluviitaleaceae bacterium]